jgi:hypothetical protein
VADVPAATELGVTLAAAQTVCANDAPGGHEQKIAKAKPARSKVLQVVSNIGLSLTDIRQMG